MERNNRRFNIDLGIKQMLVIGVFIFFYAPVCAVTDNSANQIKRIWFQPRESEDPSFSWKANWIWTDEAAATDVILARRSFFMDKVPPSAVLRITASSKYQLYINGEYIGRGPARCAPHHQSYDILDIAQILKEGENLIAIRVHHQDGKRSYQYTGRAGLLAQIDLVSGDSIDVIFTDASWKVSPDLSWNSDAPKISRFQQVVSDRVDFRNAIQGWEELGFDDSNWSNATTLMRKVGWPSPQKNASPQPLTPPWTSLVARDIPYLNERDVFAEKLIEAVEINTPISERPHILTGSVNVKQQNRQPVILPISSDSNSWLLIYDFGEVINGMPKLDIQGAAGTEVEIASAPFMVDNTFTHITVDSEFRDKIVLSGKRDNWEATYFKPTRYMGIIVKNNDPVKLYAAGIHQIKYPFEMKGHMSSTDAPWIKDYVEASAKTIDVCTTDGITDNYRERRQYAQTAYYAMLGSYYTFADLALQRRYLVQVSQEQTANGIMPAYAPAASDDYMIILGSNCLWIRGLRNYFLYSGDKGTVLELLPAAQKLMELLHSFTNEIGLMDNPPYAYWLDHSLNDRRGANLTINGHYWGALNDFAELLRWLKKDGDDVFDKRAKKIKQSIQLFWDEEKKLFADALINGRRSTMFSEHGNAMALATGAATPDQAKLVSQQLLADDKHDYMKRESGMTMVTPAMSYFLHMGLCSYGYVDESLALFRRRFEMMLDEETNQTLWEEWWLNGTGRTGKFQGGRTRSDAQTESAFPPALFAEFLLGVRPVKPGMREIEIVKQQNGLNHIKGVVPTPGGELTIEWNIVKNQRELILHIPEDTKVNVELESLGLQNGGTIKINGRSRHTNAEKSPFLELSKGKQVINF